MCMWMRNHAVFSAYPHETTYISVYAALAYIRAWIFYIPLHISSRRGIELCNGESSDEQTNGLFAVRTPLSGRQIVVEKQLGASKHNVHYLCLVIILSMILSIYSYYKYSVIIDVVLCGFCLEFGLTGVVTCASLLSPNNRILGPKIKLFL